jgi:hypothetical protein
MRLTNPYTERISYIQDIRLTNELAVDARDEEAEGGNIARRQMAAGGGGRRGTEFHVELEVEVEVK